MRPTQTNYRGVMDMRLSPVRLLAIVSISLLLHGCNPQVPDRIDGYLIVNEEGNLEFKTDVTWGPLFPQKATSPEPLEDGYLEDGYLEDEAAVVFSPRELKDYMQE